MLRTFASLIVVAPALVVGADRTHVAAEKVQLTIATLHAAALTTSHASGGATDAPFFVVSIAGPHSAAAMILPESGASTVRQNEALGARPLTELSLAAGDSVEVLVSVMENSRVKLSDEPRVTPLSTKRATSATERADQATQLVAPLMKNGANLLGAVSVLVTNEGGAVYWRRLECVASCKVLSGPAETALPAASGQPAAGVVELSGNGGTYHLALRAARAQQ